MKIPGPSLLDRFIPHPEAGGRHEITIHAPAELVLEVARGFDIESLWLVRTLIRLRAWMLGGRPKFVNQPAGLIAQMTGLGWGCLAEEPGSFYIAGATCQPWHAQVVFTPVAAEDFADFTEPNQVKIAWTIEAEPLSPDLTRFATETRAVATDAESRARFRRYWRKFGIGIVMIRLALLPAIRRATERRYKAAAGRA